MLLQAVALPLQEQGEGPAAHFLGPEQAPRLQVCCVADFVRIHIILLKLCHDHYNSRQCIGQVAVCISYQAWWYADCH